VNKKRREAHNLPPEKVAAPVEVGAVWSQPDSQTGANKPAGAPAAARLRGGHFFVDSNGVVAENAPGAKPAPKRTVHSSAQPAAAPGASLSQMAAAALLKKKEP
jgi:hypothetical protein